MPSLQKEMSIIGNNILGCFELTDRFLKARKKRLSVKQDFENCQSDGHKQVPYGYVI